MNITWKVDLSQESADIRNTENVTMNIIKAFRAIRYAQPYRIKVSPDGIGAQVLDRLIAAGLPAVAAKEK